MPRANKRSHFGLPIIVGAAILALSMMVSVGSRAAFVGSNDNPGNDGLLARGIYPYLRPDPRVVSLEYGVRDYQNGQQQNGEPDRQVDAPAEYQLIGMATSGTSSRATPTA